MHYVIYTEQFDFMKPYIFLNNEKRNECSINKDKIGVQLFKCMSNSYFGRQIGKWKWKRKKMQRILELLIMRIKLRK